MRCRDPLKQILSQTTSHWDRDDTPYRSVTPKWDWIPAAFKVTESTVTSKGVIIVNYERAGAVPTGSL